MSARSGHEQRQHELLLEALDSAIQGLARLRNAVAAGRLLDTETVKDLKALDLTVWDLIDFEEVE